MARQTTFRWAILGSLLIVLFAADLSIGSVAIPLTAIAKIVLGQAVTESAWADIVWNFRMTKALTCVLAGSALSLGGLQMQTLFRNPLAGPDVLGLTSGASLAVSLLFMSTAAGTDGIGYDNPWTVALAASAGCVMVFLIMIGVARKLRDNVSLLIVGLMVGAATSSIVSVLQYMSRAEEMQIYIFWTFGAVGGLSWSEIAILSAVLLVGATIAFLNVKSLNAWLLGDNYAQSLGVNISRSRLLAIVSASILTGGVTAFCGPIAFVGLAVPHLVKLLIRTHNHKLLVPAVLAGGAALVLACDALTHAPGSGHILPINAITALVGSPVVIWVILKNKALRT